MIVSGMIGSILVVGGVYFLAGPQSDAFFATLVVIPVVIGGALGFCGRELNSYHFAYCGGVLTGAIAVGSDLQPLWASAAIVGSITAVCFLIGSVVKSFKQGTPSLVSDDPRV